MTERPQNCPRCFIVRLPPDLDERVNAYRDALARERGRPVSLASTARRLLARGLEVSTPARRPKPPPSPQLGLFAPPPQKLPGDPPAGADAPP